MIEFFCADNIKKLKDFPDNSFDAIATDCPYGLGKEPDALEVLRDWVEKGYHEVKSKGGFMGREWDSFVPQPLFWKEAFRILKPGGYVAAFFGTRTYDWGVMAMRLAGFEVKDCLSWNYGSGYPKSVNVSKAIDKHFGAQREVIGIQKHPTSKDRTGNKSPYQAQEHLNGNFEITAPATDAAKQFEGFGTALKPAHEPIVLARKPLIGTIAENVLTHGTGGINIDACRISINTAVDDKRLGGNGAWKTDKAVKNVYEGGYKGDEIASSPLGRFPANLLLTHHEYCVCEGTKKVASRTAAPVMRGQKGESKGIYGDFAQKGDDGASFYADKNGMETVEAWTCVPDCPVRMLDEQTGTLQKSKGAYKRKHGDKQFLGAMQHEQTDAPTGVIDSGGASRFFYSGKASRSERNKGLEDFFWRYDGKQHTRISKAEYDQLPDDQRAQGNIHVTVKPLSLMKYVCRLICPPGGRCLDPFAGSGTTGIACEQENINFVGIELEQNSFDIAEARAKAWRKQEAKPAEKEQGAQLGLELE